MIVDSSESLKQQEKIDPMTPCTITWPSHVNFLPCEAGPEPSPHSSPLSKTPPGEPLFHVQPHAADSCWRAVNQEGENYSIPVVFRESMWGTKDSAATTNGSEMDRDRGLDASPSCDPGLLQTGGRWGWRTPPSLPSGILPGPFPQTISCSVRFIPVLVCFLFVAVINTMTKKELGVGEGLFSLHFHAMAHYYG